MSKWPDEVVDFTLFSPPYDNLRDYKGYEFDLHAIGSEVYRVTKTGGAVLMIIQDQTVSGRKTLTSFSTIVDWCENIGFNLFECLIYKRLGKPGVFWNKRFRVDHEYMPIFLKGDRLNYFDKEHIKVPAKSAGEKYIAWNRNKDGKTKPGVPKRVKDLKCPGTIFDYRLANENVLLKHEHPGTFPDRLPNDFIPVFTKPGDLVLDPMCGSGSTLVAAKMLKRRYIGIDISREYCELAYNRVKYLQTGLRADFKNVKSVKAMKRSVGKLF